MFGLNVNTFKSNDCYYFLSNNKNDFDRENASLNANLQFFLLLLLFYVDFHIQCIISNCVMQYCVKKQMCKEIKIHLYRYNTEVYTETNNFACSPVFEDIKTNRSRSLPDASWVDFSWGVETGGGKEAWLIRIARKFENGCGKTEWTVLRDVGGSRSQMVSRASASSSAAEQTLLRRFVKRCA